jgi:hypothetical protein
LEEQRAKELAIEMAEKERLLAIERERMRAEMELRRLSVILALI